MKEQLEIINASFDRVIPKDKKIGFLDFLSLVATLTFCVFYLLLFTTTGWVAIVLLTLLYKTVL